MKAFFATTVSIVAIVSASATAMAGRGGHTPQQNFSRATPAARPAPVRQAAPARLPAKPVAAAPKPKPQPVAKKEPALKVAKAPKAERPEKVKKDVAQQASKAAPKPKEPINKPTKAVKPDKVSPAQTANKDKGNKPGQAANGTNPAGKPTPGQPTKPGKLTDAQGKPTAQTTPMTKPTPGLPKNAQTVADPKSKTAKADTGSSSPKLNKTEQDAIKGGKLKPGESTQTTSVKDSGNGTKTVTTTTVTKDAKGNVTVTDKSRMVDNKGKPVGTPTTTTQKFTPNDVAVFNAANAPKPGPVVAGNPGTIPATPTAPGTTPPAGGMPAPGPIAGGPAGSGQAGGQGGGGGFNIGGLFSGDAGGGSVALGIAAAAVAVGGASAVALAAPEPEAATVYSRPATVVYEAAPVYQAATAAAPVVVVEPKPVYKSVPATVATEGACIGTWSGRIEFPASSAGLMSIPRLGDVKISDEGTAILDCSKSDKLRVTSVEGATACVGQWRGIVAIPTDRSGTFQIRGLGLVQVNPDRTIILDCNAAKSAE
jgi:hypothetical protein